MGYLVRDQLEISLYINDVEYELRALNILNYLHVAALVSTKAPTLSIGITDVLHTFDRTGIQDGIPLRVVVKGGTQSSQTYRFRKFNHKRQFNGASYTYDITGYWDAPAYWSGSSMNGIRGTSNAVLQQIAESCGLRYQGVTTNDSQLWLPQNKTWANFAKAVADQGYIDDSSCMCLALDLDGKLYYKNINDLRDDPQKVVAYRYEEGALTAVDVGIAASSGFNNAVTGYKNMRYTQSTTGDTMQTLTDTLTFQADVKAPLYNKVVRDKIGRGAVRFGPIDVGNVHPSYERASYQNTRYQNLYSQGVEILLNQPSDVRLMSRINLVLQREDANQDAVHAGQYIIAGRAIYCKGNTYAEKLLATRHGTNDEYGDG